MLINHFDFRMKIFRGFFLVGILGLILGASPVRAERNHSAGKDSQSSKTRPPGIPSNLFPKNSLEVPLTASEINEGGWELDLNGACSPEKGCPYKNKLGEVRYLPMSEKAKLKEAKEAKGKEEKKTASNEIRELTTHDQLREAFRDHTDKKCVVVVFSAENCGPCKILKSKLSSKQSATTAIFTATRPDYNFVSGHELHTKYKGSLGGGVPKVFIFTPRADGMWEAKTIKTGVDPILNAIKDCQ